MSDTPQTNGALRPLIINGVNFAVADQYTAGHTISDAEAHVLNQTRRENLRNNFSSKVEKAQEEAKKNGQPLDMAALQSEFAAYADEYEFGIRTGGVGVKADPVATEMRAIARSLVRDALKAKGIKVSALGAEKMNELIDQLISKNEDALKAKAQAVIDVRKSAADLSVTV